MSAYRWNGYAAQGGLTLPLSQLGSSSSAMRSYPGATIAVYLAGTATLATLYRDAAATLPLSNPFTADDAAYAFFYAAAGVYTIEFSSAGIAVPFSLPDVILGTDFNLFTFNVRAFGARGGINCTAAFTAAWSAAAATSGRAAIYIPADTNAYILSGPMPAFVGKSVRVYGDGVLATTLSVNYVGVSPFMSWQPDPTQYTINFVQADNFRIETSSAITVMRTIGTSFGSYFHHIHIQAHHVDAVAWNVQGWDQTSFSDCFTDAGHPFYFAKVTQGLGIGAGQCDAFSFTNMRTWSYGDVHPLYEWENGASFTRSAMGGDQTWVGGTDAIKFVSTGLFNENSFSGAHWENGTVQVVTPVLHGFMFDIEPGAVSSQLAFISCAGGSAGAQGWKLRNLTNINFFGTSFVGAWASNFTQIDIDNTCNYIQLANAFFASSNNALRTLGNALIEMYGAPVVSTNGTTFPAFAYYAKSSPAGVDYDAMTIYGQETWKKYTASLAVGASITLPTPGIFKAPALARVTVIANRDDVSDGTFAGGIFLTGWYGAAVLSDAASNLAASDTAGKLSLIYAGATYPLALKNNLAVPLRVRVLID